MMMLKQMKAFSYQFFEMMMKQEQLDEIFQLHALNYEYQK